MSLTGGANDLVTVISSRQDVQLSSAVAGGQVASVTLRPLSESFPFNSDRRWNVQVPSDLPTALSLSLGAGNFSLDLGKVQLTRATISTGASDLKITAPRPRGDVTIRLSGRASSITLEIPTAVEYRVSVDGALNSITGPMQSAAYAAAVDRVSISVSAGATSIDIRQQK